MCAQLTDSLLEQLEICEMNAWEDAYAAASGASACGVRIKRIGSALALIVSRADVLALNRLIGLGVMHQATEGSIDDAVRVFREACVPRFFVPLAPSAKPKTLSAWLETRGFRHYNNWMRLYRTPEPIPDAKSELRVKEVAPAMGEVFGVMVAHAFGWPVQTAEWIAQTVGRKGWRHYMAFDGSRPVATGALFITDHAGWLGFATTNEEYRARGAQSVLIRQRLQDAEALNCRILSVETAEDRPDHTAPSFRNLRRMGFDVAYTRPNFILAPS